MAHGYRSLQSWNQWLAAHHLGNSVLNDEKALLSQLISNHFGKQALLIGVPSQSALFSAITMPQCLLVSPFGVSPQTDIASIETDLRELPIQSGSVDLVLLPHVLERIDNPRQILHEACRVLRPEGLIVIAGFKPHGFWGLKKIISKTAFPWAGNYIQAQQVIKWLQLADFVLVEQRSCFIRPPIDNQHLFEKLAFLEKGQRPYCLAFGGIYVICARAKVLPLTPIKFKLKWKPALTPMSTTLVGHGRIIKSM